MFKGVVSPFPPPGHIALATAVFPPTTVGPTLDVLARLPLWKAGQVSAACLTIRLHIIQWLSHECVCQAYRHGTGHGVGSFLNVHEGPHGISSTTRNSSVLRTKLKVTNTRARAPTHTCPHNHHHDDTLAHRRA